MLFLQDKCLSSFIRWKFWFNVLLIGNVLAIYQEIWLWCFNVKRCWINKLKSNDCFMSGRVTSTLTFMSVYIQRHVRRSVYCWRIPEVGGCFQLIIALVTVIENFPRYSVVLVKIRLWFVFYPTFNYEWACSNSFSSYFCKCFHVDLLVPFGRRSLTSDLVYH